MSGLLRRGGDALAAGSPIKGVDEPAGGGSTGVGEYFCAKGSVRSRGIELQRRPTGSSFSCVGPLIGQFILAYHRPLASLFQLQTFDAVSEDSGIKILGGMAQTWLSTSLFPAGIRVRPSRHGAKGHASINTKVKFDTSSCYVQPAITPDMSRTLTGRG